MRAAVPRDGDHVVVAERSTEAEVIVGEALDRVGVRISDTERLTVEESNHVRLKRLDTVRVAVKGRHHEIGF